ncbi:MAG: Crp/Fnr family transcriptional regulator [Bacteroidetes bacterium]|nr:Crp/Fnr family transcriptional regulator [Bacteroidota bacterium]
MNYKISCQDCANKQCFVQQYCFADWINRIDQSKNQAWYKRGQYIFREGDRVFGIYFIQQGKVKVVSTGLNNKEQVVRLATDGHVVGHRGYGAETYPIGAIALEDTIACFVENKLLYDAFMANPKFTYSLMMFYSIELRKTEIRLRHLAQMSIREKIANTLLYIKDIYGINEKENCLNVILNRQEIADIAGTTAEQVTRQLTDFEKEKLIAKLGKKIVLDDLEGLKKIIAAHS